MILNYLNSFDLGKIVYLMEQEYTFGRSKDGKSKSHVTLAEDVSISRKHLKFMVKYSSTEVKFIFFLVIILCTFYDTVIYKIIVH